MSDPIRNHLSAEQIQAFLDGEMRRKERTLAEQHLGSCARCASEVEGWTALFEDLRQLRGHRPHEGFSDRVLTKVAFPAPRPLAARIGARARALFGSDVNEHVSTEVLQDFLDGALAARRCRTIERHLSTCAPCASEADAWIAVIRRLDALGSFAPGEHFAERVLHHVEAPARRPLAARVRGALAPIFRRPKPVVASGHVPAGILQDLVDGGLPEAAVARVRTHVHDCARCARELERWRSITAKLGSLGHFDPSEAFSERVLHAIRVGHTGALASRPRPTVWAAARSRLRRFVPETRQAIAALSGAAVTPTVVVGLAFWAVFSHPTLTVGSLVSFAWWQVTDLASAVLSSLSAGATQSAELFGVYSLLESLASAPGMVALGVVGYTVICALALRVLYNNLFANPPGPYAHVSTAS